MNHPTATNNGHAPRGVLPPLRPHPRFQFASQTRGAGPRPPRILRRPSARRSAELQQALAVATMRGEEALGGANEFEFESSRPTLRRGARGDAVVELQRKLSAAGFSPGPIDGIFGSMTDTAVRAFQRARALVVDGIVGPITWGALDAGSGGSVTPRPPASSAGSWQIPADVLAAGELQLVRYDSPPPWNGGGGCGNGLTSGARQLSDYIRANFPGVSSIGGFACRQNTANTSETSVHGTGRALDIMIPTVLGGANSSVGDPIANWLIRNAQDIGVQYIIWNRVRWAGHRRPHSAAYTGPHPHTDHIHAEINNDAAARRTPWFTRSP